MAEYIRAMDGGDGGRYADTSNIGKITAKTANFTVPGGTSGDVNFSNRGAGAAVTFTLPAPKAGTVRRFFRANSAQNILITRSGTANIVGPVTPFTGTTATASGANERASCVLVADGTDWFITPTGTWTLS